jgi:hypothetical protein
LNSLYPQANKKQITLPDDALPLLNQYEKALAKEKAADASVL